MRSENTRPAAQAARRSSHELASVGSAKRAGEAAYAPNGPRLSVETRSSPALTAGGCCCSPTSRWDQASVIRSLTWPVMERTTVPVVACRGTLSELRLNPWFVKRSLTPAVTSEH